MTQLADLAKPFPSNFVQQKPGKFAADYVEHGIVTQKLLAVIGPFSMQVVDKVYDGDLLTGCVLRCTFSIDGREVSIEEAGDVEHPEQKGTNGARLKDAVSDALKRCSMRVGVALDLWGKGGYFLPAALERRGDAA